MERNYKRMVCESNSQVYWVLRKSTFLKMISKNKVLLKTIYFKCFKKEY